MRTVVPTRSKITEANTMANNLSRVFSTDLTPSSSEQGQIEQYRGDSNPQSIYKKTMEQVAAERAQAYKTHVALEETKGIHLHAQGALAEFADKRDAITKNQNGRSQEMQQFIDDTSNKLSSMYASHVGAIVNTGVGKIHDEVNKDIVPDTKKGWFRR